MTLKGKAMQYEELVLRYLRPYLENESVQKMKTYIQHGVSALMNTVLTSPVIVCI